MMSNLIKCGEGMLLQLTEGHIPRHDYCNKPGWFLRWKFNIKPGSIWICNLCDKSWIWKYYESQGRTTNLQDGYYWFEDV